MGNSQKIHRAGIKVGSRLGITELNKLWELYTDEKDMLSYVGAHKFLKEFSTLAGLTYVDRLADVIIYYCDKENLGKLSKAQFENLLFYTARAAGFAMEDDLMKNKGEEDRRIFRQNMKTLDDGQREEGKYSLCFPSISTSVYKFDINRAAKVATRVIKDFLSKYPDIDVRLYLVDIQESITLETFRKQRETEELTDPRYIIQKANITLLRDYGIPSCYIVNASNPSFHGRGSGTNRAIHTAANSGIYNLEKETRKLYSKNAKTARAYPVELREGSPLRDFQGVKSVIHVVGPNMSPKRPRYLEQNYDLGEKLLKRAYESILRTFLRQTKLEVPVEESVSESDADVPQIHQHRQQPKKKAKSKKNPEDQESDDNASDDESSGELSHNASIEVSQKT